MYYLRNGVGEFAPELGKYLGIAFAVFGAIAAFSIGNAVQVHSMADTLHASWNVPTWITGIVVDARAVFALTTILGWSYYGERCWQFLFKEKSVIIYRVLWVLAAGWFVNRKIGFVWKLSDALNGLMAVPNLIGLLLLAPMTFKVTCEYFDKNPEAQAQS